MTTIFRVERITPRYGKIGAGPYHGRGPVSDSINEVHSNDPTRPVPIDIIRDHEVCGFTSLEDLRAWFAGWGQPLYDAGYVIASYTVEDAASVRVPKVFSYKDSSHWLAQIVVPRNQLSSRQIMPVTDIVETSDEVAEMVAETVQKRDRLEREIWR